MNLIELAEEITEEQLVELTARFLLNKQQRSCYDMLRDKHMIDEVKESFRDVLKSTEALATSAVMFAGEDLIPHFKQRVHQKALEHAEEYTRTVW